MTGKSVSKKNPLQMNDEERGKMLEEQVYSLQATGKI